MVFYLIFMLPLIYFLNWWCLVVLLLFGFMFFFSKVWFLGYLSSIGYILGFDLISFCMIFLSFWIILLMMMASVSVFFNCKFVFEFLFINLMLLFILIFCFGCYNLFYFYLFFEFSLIPTLILIFGWGYQPERLGAGFYFLFYTLFASLPFLLSIFYVFSSYGTVFIYLISLECNIYLYLSFILAFLVSMPMVFLHFWLPRAHVEAPVSGSMILAGVLLKLGGYGLIRMMNFIWIYSSSLSFVWISLSLYGSFVVGLLCLCQFDMKSLIAYSSVSHMGLVLCGIMTLNNWGLYGSLILMIGHGLCSSGLFCLANIVYERLNSRSLFIGSGLMSLMPSLTFFWFLLSANNMASPPSLNLLGEVLLINSLVAWDCYSSMFLGISSFLACGYSIYLFSYTQHGVFSGNLFNFSFNNFREYYLLFFHLLPLNFLILSVDIFVLWF